MTAEETSLLYTVLSVVPRRVVEVNRALLRWITGNPGYCCDDVRASVVPFVIDGGYRAVERANQTLEVLLRLLVVDGFVRLREDSVEHDWVCHITDKGREALHLLEVHLGLSEAVDA